LWKAGRADTPLRSAWTVRARFDARNLARIIRKRFATVNERIDRVRERFLQVDREVAELRAATALACPTGCGACCLSPHVEASIAELRPLAAALAEDGRAEPMLAELERRAASDEPNDACCALYVPEAGSEGRRGRCNEYALRPLVCRLYGFAARRDRHGAPELVACRTMRDADAQGVARAELHVRGGGAVASLGEHARGLAAELPRDGSERLPINEALASALRSTLFEQVLRRAELEADAAAPPLDPEHRPAA
jgi:Fe-S-cluster containining protein